jgi:uncharacterized membrane protein YkvA (DUF1232 family)
VNALVGTVCISPAIVAGSVRIAVVVLRLVLTVAAAAVVSWLVLLAVLAVVRPEGTTLTDAVRLLPDLIGLVRRLVRDPTVPRSARVTVWLLLGYLLLPIDLVPDVIPVLGWADDVVVVALALRRVVRLAGIDAIDRNWRGSEAGLEVVHRLARRR